MSFLNKREARFLEEDSEWHLVLLDIADLIKNGSNEPEIYAAKAIGFVLNHIEREEDTHDTK